MTNISAADPPIEDISRLLTLVGQPVRIQILFVISRREACVCHLEAALGLRQSSISQHLMALRKAGLVTPCREGRNIFYQLEQTGVITLLQQAAQLAGIQPDVLQRLGQRPVENCPCPQCNPGMEPAQSCTNPIPKHHK